jgi:hypothetical protein
VDTEIDFGFLKRQGLLSSLVTVSEGKILFLEVSNTAGCKERHTEFGSHYLYIKAPADIAWLGKRPKKVHYE